MGPDSTITEQDMDAASRQFVQSLTSGLDDGAPDLDVDGLSDSILARLKRFLAFGRS